MTELWMNYATRQEIERYVNKRSVQAIRKHLGEMSLSESARNLAEQVRRNVEARVF